MAQQRLTLSDFAPGKALAWDVVDADGSTVMIQGHVVEEEERTDLVRMLESGLFAAEPKPVAMKKTEQISVLRVLNTAQKNL